MKSKVYFLPWNRRGELTTFLKKAGIFEHIKAKNFTALKIHFGEEGNEGYIKPEYVKQVVKIAREKTAFPFLVDCSTLYGGQRSDAYHHLLVANKHGFNIDNCGCPVMIADGLRGISESAIEVNLKNCKTVLIGKDIALADNYIFLNHFKGHEISGFGGALKNIGMGCGSKAGKYEMHNNSKPEMNTEKCVGCGLCAQWCNQKALEVKDGKIAMDIDKCAGCGQCIVNCPNEVFELAWSSGSESVQEKIVEYAAGVLKGKKSSSVNFLNHISKFCDCFAFNKNEPLMDDVGIVAGIDPVAVDAASYDLVNKAYGKDFFKELYSDIDPTIQLKYAEEVGLGSRDYELINY